jgi:hypothetical protein
MQKQTTKMNMLVQWQKFLANTMESLSEVKEEMKRNTEDQRAIIKDYNKRIKIARWKIGKLMSDIEETVTGGTGMQTTITLDDFDVGDSIDYELAVGEYKASLKEGKE